MGAGAGLFAELPQQLVNGLTLGSVYALIALGYSMVYGTLEMLNFAHGEVFMVGAFIGWGVMAALLSNGVLIVGPVVALLLMMLAAMVGTGVLGAGIEWLAYRPLRRAQRLAPLLTALGVSILLQNVFMLLTSGRAQVYDTQALVPAGWTWTAGGITLSFTRALIIGVAILLMFGLERLIQGTRLGLHMRATAEDSETAALMGIRPNFVISATFVIGSALAGAAGVLVGLYYMQIDFLMGFTAGMKAFTAAVLGGIGNVRGAMLGGLLLGLVEALGVAFISPLYKDALSLAVLILVLLVRPTGLLGERVPDRA